MDNLKKVSGSSCMCVEIFLIVVLFFFLFQSWQTKLKDVINALHAKIKHWTSLNFCISLLSLYKNYIFLPFIFYIYILEIQMIVKLDVAILI